MEGALDCLKTASLSTPRKSASTVSLDTPFKMEFATSTYLSAKTMSRMVSATDASTDTSWLPTVLVRLSPKVVQIFSKTTEDVPPVSLVMFFKAVFVTKNSRIVSFMTKQLDCAASVLRTFRLSMDSVTSCLPTVLT